MSDGGRGGRSVTGGAESAGERARAAFTLEGSKAGIDFTVLITLFTKADPAR